jgi:endonuclease-3
LPAVTSDQRKALILRRLARAYPGATTALHHKTIFQLLIAVILSAQTTDARVNIETPHLFEKYPTPESLASASRRDVERIIKSLGFYHVKAKSIIGAARALVERFGGHVPKTMDELLTIPGVGRKTANVVLAVAFRQSAIAVDTHVFRVANRLALARAKTAAKMELALMKVVPKAQWGDVSQWLILHGRQVCHARNPQCADCMLCDLCPSAKHFLRLSAGKKTG